MNANEYQKKTNETAIYPGAGTGDNQELTYLALGLTSEAGEVASNIKKLLRDGLYSPGNIAYELGDVAWYLARLAEAVGYNFEDIFKINYAKLKQRKEKGTLKGSGDNR
jgi:NTP pyrophosphatase (non-canonical NTP hydrolase)